MSKDTISESLGIAPEAGMEIITVDESQVVTKYNDETVEDDTVAEDLSNARDTYYDVIKQGTDALNEILSVAKASEEPKAFEAVSNMIKTIVDSNKELVNLALKKKDTTASQVNADGDVNITNNNMFVGSTKELQDLIYERMNGSVNTEQDE